jgi:signal transduction histidine kinase
VFSSAQINIAQEVAAQLAIGISQARLYEQVKRQTEELERRVQDRTAELKATQESLVRAERLAVLGKLAGGVSHELRNPLGVITNAAYYLNIVAPDDARIRKHVAIVQREAARATRIISGLLDFARVAPPRPVAVDLNVAVRELLDELSVPATVKISLKLAEALPTTVADADHVRLMISNILTNGIQAMPEGGVLTIETGRHGNELWLAIADTGPGMDAAIAAKVFDPLFTTKPMGIGLGLAIVKGLADRNAVRIELDTAPGQGARFTLRFGFPGAEADSPAGAQPAASVGAESGTSLAAEPGTSAEAEPDPTRSA